MPPCEIPHPASPQMKTGLVPHRCPPTPPSHSVLNRGTTEGLDLDAALGASLRGSGQKTQKEAYQTRMVTLHQSAKATRLLLSRNPGAMGIRKALLAGADLTSSGRSRLRQVANSGGSELAPALKRMEEANGGGCPSLQHLCRVALRRRLASQDRLHTHGVDALQLPLPLQRLLSYGLSHGACPLCDGSPGEAGSWRYCPTTHRHLLTQQHLLGTDCVQAQQRVRAAQQDAMETIDG